MKNRAYQKTNRINWSVIILCNMLLNACASQPTPIPDSLSANAQAYQARCSSCHSLPHPKRHTFTEWKHLLPLMEQRMHEKNVPPLELEEKQNIISYLKQYAR